MKETIICRVIAGVIQRDGLFLIAQRAKRDAYYGLWEFPGGKVEKGETDQECLARELFEELSIKVVVDEFLCESSFVTVDKTIVLAAYRVHFYTGEPLLKEHVQIRWVKPYEFDSYDFPHPDLAIIRMIREQL